VVGTISRRVAPHSVSARFPSAASLSEVVDRGAEYLELGVVGVESIQGRLLEPSPSRSRSSSGGLHVMDDITTVLAPIVPLVRLSDLFITAGHC